MEIITILKVGTWIKKLNSYENNNKRKPVWTFFLYIWLISRLFRLLFFKNKINLTFSLYAFYTTNQGSIKRFNINLILHGNYWHSFFETCSNIITNAFILWNGLQKNTLVLRDITLLITCLSFQKTHLFSHKRICKHSNNNLYLHSIFNNHIKTNSKTNCF